MAAEKGPLKLYVKDFDNNGTIEQVMCYTLEGQEYTFLAKDELERELPVLKKALPEICGGCRRLERCNICLDDLLKQITESGNLQFIMFYK